MNNKKLIHTEIKKYYSYEAMRLEDYIELHFQGNKSSFAKAMNVLPQQVTKWLKNQYIISNGKMYGMIRELKEK